MDIRLDNSLNIAFNAECDDLTQKLVEANNCGDIQPNFDIFSDSIIDLISEKVLVLAMITHIARFQLIMLWKTNLKKLTDSRNCQNRN